ncbi:MAG: acyl carrier protein [Candidatus Aminicenantales bacterium]
MGIDESAARLEIKEKLRRYIAENFLMFAGVVTFQDSDSFLDLGIIDSTGILELLQFIEGAFNIHVEDDETVPENLDSLDNLSAYILRKAASGGPEAYASKGRLPSDDVPR